MDSRDNIDSIVEKLESHPALKRQVHGYLYCEEIAKAINGTSRFESNVDTHAISMSMELGSDRYILSLGKRLNHVIFGYKANTAGQRIRYWLQLFTTPVDFEGCVSGLAGDQEMADIIRTANGGFSILARLDRLDLFNRVESSRPLLLVPEVSAEDSEKIYRWEESNSTRNSPASPLARRILEIPGLYKRLTDAYDRAILAGLQGSYDFIKKIIS